MIRSAIAKRLPASNSSADCLNNLSLCFPTSSSLSSSRIKENASNLLVFSLLFVLRIYIYICVCAVNVVSGRATYISLTFSQLNQIDPTPKYRHSICMLLFTVDKFIYEMLVIKIKKHALLANTSNIEHELMLELGF